VRTESKDLTCGSAPATRSGGSAALGRRKERKEGGWRLDFRAAGTAAGGVRRRRVGFAAAEAAG
jgi:hypothetical protein